MPARENACLVFRFFANTQWPTEELECIGTFAGGIKHWGNVSDLDKALERTESLQILRQGGVIFGITKNDPLLRISATVQENLLLVTLSFDGKISSDKIQGNLKAFLTESGVAKNIVAAAIGEELEVEIAPSLEVIFLGAEARPLFESNETLIV